MFTCPNDHRPLTRAPVDHGVVWACASCGGRVVGLGVLRRTVAREQVTDLWLRAQDGRAASGRACPVCERAMALVSLSGTGPAVDVCRTCLLVWFDPQEFEQLRPLPHPSVEPPMPVEANEILAVAKIEAMKERASRSWGAEGPDARWKYLPALLGMPVEYDQPALKRAPLMTWTLIAFIVAFSVRAFFNLDAAVSEFGLIPADAMRRGGLTFITSFLLHGGLFHLIGNMYFLLIFGDNVEDYLGRWRYLLLIAGAALVGDLGHIALDPQSTIPVIGASGGISGVLAYYILTFPKARLGILMRILLYFRWIRLPAYGWGLFWIGFQVLGVYLQITGASNVSAAAHLGGVAVGIAFWWATRNR